MSEQMAYVGIYECGCAQSATIDDPKHPSRARYAVSNFMRGGATIERWSSERVRKSLCLANHKPACPHPGECPDFAKGALS